MLPHFGAHERITVLSRYREMNRDNGGETRTALTPIHLPAKFLIERGRQRSVLALSSNSFGRHGLLVFS